MNEQAIYTEHVYQEYHYKGYEPIHQREEIVRCRDCEFETTRWSPFHGENVTYCERFVHLGGYNSSAYVEPDGFCAWGERRERESAEVWNQWSADDVTCSEES